MRTKFTLVAMFLLLTVFVPALPQANAQASDESSAAETAILLSQFESRGETGSLYAYLHLDAKVLIPAKAVAGWYRDAFFPSGPGVISVTNVAIVPWTWGVTGVTYPETAEVSFTQPFASSEAVNDIVRLVKENGEWHWFFGRSLEFVNQQIAQYAPQYPLLDDLTMSNASVADEVAPWGLDTFSAAAVTESTLSNALPDIIVDHELGSVDLVHGITMPLVAGDELLARYHTPPEQEIPSGEVHVFDVIPGHSVLDVLAIFDPPADGGSNFTILRDGRLSQSSVVYVFVELYANDAVGYVPVLYWGHADGTQLFSASMLDYVSLRLLVIDLAHAMS